MGSTGSRRSGSGARRALGALLTALGALGALGAGAAWAGPTDLDPTFNPTGTPPGLALAPAGQRLDGQAAPLLGADGSITVGGLLRNPSDRVFLSRLRPDGTLATGFGKQGALHTNTKADGRRAPTAIGPDGKLVVAGAAEKAGRIAIERFNPDGTSDSRFGPDGRGRVFVDLGGTFAVPTALAVVADGILLAVDSDAGGRRFTLLKLTNTGAPTPTFGTGGIARVGFPEGPSIAHDLAVVGDRILLAGAVLRGTGQDTALARLTGGGQPAPAADAFGPAGRLVVDLGGGADDAAAALVAESTGAIAVAGPAATAGMVARFTPSGAPESGFGVGGVVRGGFVDAGSQFFPVDLALARNRRLVVVGRAFDPTTSTSRWNVARLSSDTTEAPDGLDLAFGDGGRRALAPCANTAGHGPTGVTVAARQRILIAGGCGADGTLAVMRLFGTSPFPKPLSFALAPAAAGAGHERIPLDRIDRRTSLAALLGGTATLQSAPLRSTPLRSTPLRSTPLRSTPLRSTPLRSTPLRSTPLLSDALDHVLLSELVLRTTTWPKVLAGTKFADVPLQTLTLRDVKDVPAVRALPLDEIDLNATPLRDVTLAALLLFDRRLNHLPAPAGGWDAFLAGKGVDCGGNGSACSLLTLELKGIDLFSYYAKPLPLSTTAVGTGADASPLALVKLRDLQMSLTPWGSLEAKTLPGFFTCGSSCSGSVGDNQENLLADKTVGDLIAADVRDVTFGDLLLGMVPRDEIPFEQAPLADLLAAATLRDEELWSVSSSFGLDCDQVAGMTAAFAVPGDARPVRRTAKLTVNGAPMADPGFGDGPGFDLTKACAGRSGDVDVALSFGVEPGSVLGPDAVSLKLTGSFGQTQKALATITDDSRDDKDNHFDLRDDAALERLPIVTGHLAGEGDSDTLTFTARAGDIVTFSLSHLPDDYDVAIFGPENSGPESAPLRSTPLRSTPLRSTPVPDSSAEGTDPEVLPPDTVQDIPLRSTPLRSTSINRGTADESASVRVRPGEEGKVFTVQVSGYNGASDADPWVGRLKVTPGAPAPECEAPAPVGDGTPGDLPSADDVPDDAETLILLNRQRMPGVADDAEELAAAAGKAVVLPVDGDSGVRGAYAGWDATKRCSAAAANAVVQEINRVVDSVRDANGGLPELRHMALLGPDAVLPQVRVPDATVLSNEVEFADELVLGGKDNAQSRGLRDSYVFSDDGYADLDPQPGPVYEVDLAIGRLVETREQIEAQIDAYVKAHEQLVADGASNRKPHVDPDSSFVTGYDFLRDAADETFDGLAPAVKPGGGQTKLNDDTWSAADALAGLNRAERGFTAVNAHYDHFRALPADAFSGAGDPNALLHAKDARPAPGSGLFTVGCHGGLNFSVRPSSGGGDTLLDWTEQMMSRKKATGGFGPGAAFYGAESGFGYGDTLAVAYSERVMAEFGGYLGSRDVTVGQAFMLAKQETGADTGVADDYVNKAIHESIFYGIPMWRVGADGNVGAPALPTEQQAASGAGTASASAASAGTAQTTDLDALRTSDEFSVTPDLARRNSSRGSHWDVTGATVSGGEVAGTRELVVQHRPLQPKVSIDVTPRDADGKPQGAPPVHGALIEGLKSTDETGVDPVIAVPTIDDSAHEEEPPAGKPFFPAALQATTPVAAPEGSNDLLTLVVGQSRSEGADEETHVQRLFTNVEGRVFRSASADWDRPNIRHVDAVVLDGLVSFTVVTRDEDVTGGAVMFRVPGNSTWRRADLAAAGPGRFGGAATLSGNPTAIEDGIVQLVDRAGNVGTSSFKVRGYRFAEEPDEGAVKIDPPQPNDQSGRFYVVSPQVWLDGDGSDALFESSVDGAAFRPYAPPTRLTPAGDGAHVVRFRDSREQTAQKSFVVDLLPPSVVGEPTTSPNEFGWYNTRVTVRWRCADAVSGVAVCPEPSITPSGDYEYDDVEASVGEGEDITVRSGPATDNVGHEATGSLGGIDIDATRPTIEAVIRPLKGEGEPATQTDDSGRTWYREDLRVEFQCDDALSGIASCPEDRIVTDEGQTVVEGTAVDRAGNRRSTGKIEIWLDKTAPTIREVRNPREPDGANGWYRLKGEEEAVTLSFECADEGGSDVIRCSPFETQSFSEDGVHDYRAEAEDGAGNVTVQEGRIRLDRTQPAVEIQPRDGPYAPDERLIGSASDATSGLDLGGFSFGDRKSAVRVEYRRYYPPQFYEQQSSIGQYEYSPATTSGDGSGATTSSEEATATSEEEPLIRPGVCESVEGNPCGRWRAELPTVGQWTVVAKAIDRAGNVAATDPIVITVEEPVIVD